MSVSYIKAVETENFEEFELAREQFGFILNELVSEDKAHSEHGDIEFFLKYTFLLRSGQSINPFTPIFNDRFGETWKFWLDCWNDCNHHKTAVH